MHRVKALLCLLVMGAAASVALHSQTGPAVIYEGARLILGPASAAPIADGAFVVQNGMITAIGAKGAITAPAGATRVDLTGKTVMPALITTHTHFGYSNVTAQGALPSNYTPENLADQFRREAFYGFGTVNDGGTAVIPISLKFQADQQAGKYPGTAAYVFNVGVTPTNGGPDTTLRAATRPMHANIEVDTADAARLAVREIAAIGVTHLKIWAGDREGTYPAMPYQVYNAVIDEAHKHKIMVHAHAIGAEDQKTILRAGPDFIVHFLQEEKMDDEEVALIRQHKPYWAGTELARYGAGDACDPFYTQVLPAQVVQRTCNPTAAPANAGRGGAENAGRGGAPTNAGRGGAPANAGRGGANRDEIVRTNFKLMRDAGARFVLGTDAGIGTGTNIGSSEHSQLTAFVKLGMSPAEAIQAGTSLAAEALGLKDVGTLATGTHADFLVLNANPLDDILNVRKISAVYLRGTKIDREAMLANFAKVGASQ